MIGFPLDSHVTYENGVPKLDRAVSSAPLRKLIKSLFSDGVMPNPSSCMQVTAKSNLNITVRNGFAICNGCMKYQEADVELALDKADANYARIDKIVLRLDDNADVRSCEFAIKKGTPSASPVSLGLNRNSTVWEIALADVTVKANATTITNADIKDLRHDSSVCGVISSISEFDTTTLYQQVQSDLAEFKSEEQASFMEWFESIQKQLTSDTAGNLQTQILTERARIDELVAQRSSEPAESTELEFVGTMTSCNQIKIASNGLNAVLRIYNLKWTNSMTSTYDTIARFPDGLVPIVFEDGNLDVLYESNDIKLIVQGNSLRVFRKNTGTSASHSIMLTYALKDPVMAELSDMRVGADGVTYPTAGEAIREQFRNIEGFDVVADVASKMDSKNAVGTGSFSIGRKSGTTVGTSSTTLGNNCEASGNWAVAGGYASSAKAQCAIALGNNAEASGTEAVSIGNHTKATGTVSTAMGSNTEALAYQMAIGHFNDTSVATANQSSGASDGTAFVIGNGASGAPSNAFRVTGRGEVIGKSAYQATGADLAELREWIDGNPNGEDRRGYFVTMDGLNIRIAKPDDYICGIISGNPCLIGNADEDWLGRYVFDEFGAFVYETVEEVDEEGNIVTFEQYKMNPEYDPEREYVRREDRPEWDFVGLTGVIAVRDDGTCEVNGFCKCAEGGIATKSDGGYRVVERVNDSIVKVLFFLTGEAF